MHTSRVARFVDTTELRRVLRAFAEKSAGLGDDGDATALLDSTVEKVVEIMSNHPDDLERKDSS